MTNSPILILLVSLAVLLGSIGVLWALAPMPKAMVDRFEQRQRLVVQPTVATYVVSALLIPFRWRRAGLLLGLLLGMLWSLRSGSLTLSFLPGFLGWFAGAVIAQWRMGSLRQVGERRIASLAPRNLRSYLTRFTEGAVALAEGVTIVAAGLALARSGWSVEWFGWAAYAVLACAALVFTAHTIVARASGFTDPAMTEADDALRTYGLAVISGCAIAATYPAISGFALLAAYPDGVPFPVDPAWTLLVFLGCVWLGWFVATRSRSVRAQAPAAAAEVAV